MSLRSAMWKWQMCVSATLSWYQRTCVRERWSVVWKRVWNEKTGLWTLYLENVNRMGASKKKNKKKKSRKKKKKKQEKKLFFKDQLQNSAWWNLQQQSSTLSTGFFVELQIRAALERVVLQLGSFPPAGHAIFHIAQQCVECFLLKGNWKAVHEFYFPQACATAADLEVIHSGECDGIGSGGMHFFWERHCFGTTEH